MDDGSQLLLLVILVFFFFAAFFAVAETSFASVSKVRVKAAAERGDKRAKKALKVLEDFDSAVTSILIGTNVTHLGVASIVTVLVMRKWGPSLVSVSTLITTVAVFFFSEMLPKSIAKRYCDSLSLLTAAPLLFFMKIFRPLAFILTAIGQAAARLFGQHEEVSVTEEELYDIIEDMADDGMLGEEQSELITSALDFGDMTVDSILTEREQIAALSLNTPAEEVVSFLLSNKYSRYPVYDGSIDKIIGTLQMRKYLKAYRKDKQPDLAGLIDPAFVVHRGESVSELLNDMNKKKISVAIVLDDEGRTCGMTTVEDALEALVGDVWGGAKA